jgi:hypothetical protein
VIAIGGIIYYNFSNPGFAYEENTFTSIETSGNEVNTAVVEPETVNEPAPDVPEVTSSADEIPDVPEAPETPETVIEDEDIEAEMAENEVMDDLVDEDEINENVINEDSENEPEPAIAQPVETNDASAAIISFSDGIYNAENKTVSYTLTIEAVDEMHNVLIENIVQLTSDFSIPGNGAVISDLVVNYNATRTNLVSDMQINGNKFIINCPRVMAGDIIVILYEADLSEVYGYQLEVGNECTVSSDTVTISGETFLRVESLT